MEAAPPATAAETWGGREGVWGRPVGSFTNGCESDYALTRLVGEPFNTLAALAIVGIGLFGLYHCAPPGHELRTRATYLALALLGAHPHP